MFLAFVDISNWLIGTLTLTTRRLRSMIISTTFKKRNLSVVIHAKIDTRYILIYIIYALEILKINVAY